MQSNLPTLSPGIFFADIVSPSYSMVRRRLGDDLSKERLSLLPWLANIRHKTLHFINHLAIITDRATHQKHKHNGRPIFWSRNQHDFPLRFIDTDNFSQHHTQTQRLTEANLIELSFDVKWRGMDGWCPSRRSPRACYLAACCRGH